MSTQISYEGAKLLYDPCPGDSWEGSKRLYIQDLEGEAYGLSVKRGCWKLILDDQRFLVVHGGPQNGVIQFRQASFITAGRVEDRRDVRNAIQREPAEDLFDIFIKQVSETEGVITNAFASREKPLLWFSDNLWSSKISLRFPNYLKMFFGEPLAPIPRSGALSRNPNERPLWISLKDKVAAALRDECLRLGYPICREESYTLSDDPAFRSSEDYVTLKVDTRQPAYHILPRLDFQQVDGGILGTCVQKDDLPYQMNFMFDTRSKLGFKIEEFVGIK